MRAGDWVGSRADGVFRLCETIGRGSQGTVWLAEGWQNGRHLGPVAVKAFDEGAGAGELERLKDLSHRHVVRTYWVGTHEGKPCLAMEYAEGGSLAGLLRVYPAGLPSPEVAGLLLGVIAGLLYLHAPEVAGGGGMPHGDLKPGNVLICQGRPKLCDPQDRLGTPAYAAPERFEVGALPSCESDVYALGVMAWELLTGRLPGAGAPEERRAAELRPQPDPPAELPEPWRELLAGCLARDPARRWPLERVRQSLVSLGPAERPEWPDPDALDWGPDPRGPARDPAGWGPEEVPSPAAVLPDPAPGEECEVAGAVFCYVPPGSYLTDADPDSGGPFHSGKGDQAPEGILELRVTRGFWVLKSPVTNGLWERVMDAPAPSRFVGTDRPVERVPWSEAVGFCNALSRIACLEPAYSREGRELIWPGPNAPGIRLLTEAEWELAARADRAGADQPASAAAAWYRRTQTAPVGRLAPNGWGLVDMLGNVWEWVWDWYGPRPPGRPADNPVGPWEGTRRVCKGGSWRSSALSVRPAARDRNRPDDGRDFLGFRVGFTHVPSRGSGHASSAAWTSPRDPTGRDDGQGAR